MAYLQNLKTWGKMLIDKLDNLILLIWESKEIPLERKESLS